MLTIATAQRSHVLSPLACGLALLPVAMLRMWWSSSCVRHAFLYCSLCNTDVTHLATVSHLSSLIQSIAISRQTYIHYSDIYTPIKITKTQSLRQTANRSRACTCLLQSSILPPADHQYQYAEVSFTHQRLFDQEEEEEGDVAEPENEMPDAALKDGNNKTKGTY